LSLDAGERDRVAAIAGGTDRAQLAFARACYLAFQIGRHALAIDVSPAPEQARLRERVDWYRARLR
jgi:hypothetical protein